MSAPLSIVIPTLNAMGQIGPTLGSIAPGLQAGLIKELVISDGGSTDEVAEIAEELGIAKGTVKSRLFRGKAMLKERLIALGIPTELRNSTVQLIEQRSKELNLGEDPDAKA